MLEISEILKVLFLGIVEGITEWLPISSTGHMLLVDEFITLEMSGPFKEMFFVVIQLGAILAVVLLFWKSMFPFQFKDRSQPVIKRDIITLWFKVALACVPGAVILLLFDDVVEAYLHTPLVIALALIVYGVAFILVERSRRKHLPTVQTLTEISFRTALGIGLFQVLSIIPGTSRSGATIIGALLLGVSRTAAAEFTFFMAVPVMFGMSALKLIKFGFCFTSAELTVLGLGMISAFLVSLLVIRLLMQYIRNHDFQIFGLYRIVLGLLVLAYFFWR